MSRDFSPQQCWIVNNIEHSKDLYLSNLRFFSNGEWHDMYTEEELADRKAHKYIAVLACDLYNKFKKVLSAEQFERLNNDLKELTDADTAGESTARFPKEMTDWYYNRNDHYYHEPNDEEFMEFVLKNYT